MFSVQYSIESWYYHKVGRTEVSYSNMKFIKKLRIEVQYAKEPVQLSSSGWSERFSTVRSTKVFFQELLSAIFQQNHDVVWWVAAYVVWSLTWVKNHQSTPVQILDRSNSEKRSNFWCGKVCKTFNAIEIP